MALFNVFRAENHLHIEVKWVGTGKECVAKGTKCFIALGVFSVELLATKFQWSALQIGQDSSIYTAISKKVALVIHDA